VKARPIAFAVEESPSDAALRALAIRFSETLLLSDALDDDDGRRIHDFRISCKRLRYAIELFRDTLPPAFRHAGGVLSQLQDVLGEVHDCDVLDALAEQSGADRLRRRIGRDRRRKLDAARRLWRASLRHNGELQSAAALVLMKHPPVSASQLHLVSGAEA
jgi:CHAD domain-containing protein